jgi:hypothetical protein
MTRMAQTAMAPSALTEQSITASLTVGVVHDLDDGQPALVASTQGNQGDLQVVTVAQVFARAAEQRSHLNRQERLALAYAAATTEAPTGEPHTWTAADRKTGMPLKVTCMSGCHGFHLEAAAGTATAEDVCCTQYDTANSTELQIGCGSDDGNDWATLSVEIHSDPVHPDEAKRVPLAAIEVTEDHYIEGLDPNGLAVVIDKLEQRVAAMRIRHAELVRIRTEYFGRQA